MRLHFDGFHRVLVILFKELIKHDSVVPKERLSLHQLPLLLSRHPLQLCNLPVFHCQRVLRGSEDVESRSEEMRVK